MLLAIPSGSASAQTLCSSPTLAQIDTTLQGRFLVGGTTSGDQDGYWSASLVSAINKGWAARAKTAGLMFNRALSVESCAWHDPNERYQDPTDPAELQVDVTITRYQAPITMKYRTSSIPANLLTAVGHVGAWASWLRSSGYLYVGTGQTLIGIDSPASPPATTAMEQQYIKLAKDLIASLK